MIDLWKVKGSFLSLVRWKIAKKSTTDENMSFDIDHRDGESDVRNKDPKASKGISL